MPPMTTMKAEATDNQAPFSEHGPAASMLYSPLSSAKLEESAPRPYPETNPNPTAKIEEVANSQALEDSENVEQEATFPQQLMDVIEQEMKDGGATINGLKVVEWLPSGDAFVIRDKKSFERVVLPRYFSAKCKFMSFVRKLYRWGFRQVEKDRQGIMVFMHANFIRGDKQRCLKMRSIVKKQHAQPQPFAALAAAGRLQPFGLNQFGMMGSNLLGDAMAASQFQSPNQMYPSFNQGGDNMMNARGMGLGGSSSLFAPNQLRGNMGMPSMNIPNQLSRDTIGMDMPNQFSGSSIGVTSRDMFNAGLRLERMEKQQQLQMQSMFNNNTGPILSPLNQGSAVMAQNGSFGNCFNGGIKSDNELAMGMATHLSTRQ